MIATAITLAIIWFAGSMLLELVRRNRGKIIAALEGRSWAATYASGTRSVTIRFSPHCTALEPAPRPALRAAA